jgi:hypothetical protein
VVVDSINFSSFQRHWGVSALLLPRERPPTKIAMALQRAARARLYKLLLAAAVQSHRPDLIEFGDLRPRGEGAETARRRLRTRSNSDGTVTMFICKKNTAKFTVENTYTNTVRYTVGNTFIY